MPQVPPEDDRSFSEKVEDKIKGGNKSKLFLIIAAVVLLLVVIICIAAAISARNNAKIPDTEATTAPEATVMVVEPTPEPTPVPEVAQAVDTSWVNIYKSFLESEPTVNSKVLQNAELYGFDGTVTAELFALADVNADGIPELLLATKPDSLPGWNVSGADGIAVERYIVCGIENGHITPLMCGGVDFDLYPLALSVNDQWLLEQSQDGSSHTMVFTSPLSQSSSRQLKYEFAVEERSNTQGQSFEMPVERYYIDGSRVTVDTWLDELFPNGAETLSYSPIFFKELAPGSLDNLEGDWNNRQSVQLNQQELSKLWTAASSDAVTEESIGAIDYTNGVYCISYQVGEDNSAVMVLGIDSGSAWGYVADLTVDSVSINGADVWLDSATGSDLPEGQVYQFVLGISIAEGSTPTELTTELTLTLHDGSKVTQTLSTAIPAV